MAEEAFSPDEYWEERLTTGKGLVGVGHARMGRYFNYWAYKVRRHVFRRQVAATRVSARRARVLDIGSGSGFYIRLWKELGATHITGADLTNVAVRDLKKDYPSEEFFQCDIGDVNFNKEGELQQYDIVSCMDVLFHVVDDKRFEQAITNIASRLNNGGHFIYSDTFLHGKEIRGRHQVCRTKEYLYRVLEANGFEIITRRPFMYLTNNPIDSTNLILRINWLAIYLVVSRINIIGWFPGAADLSPSGWSA
jgi:predicted TPR repeat methyltransferase